MGEIKINCEFRLKREKDNANIVYTTWENGAFKDAQGSNILTEPAYINNPPYILPTEISIDTNFPYPTGSPPKQYIITGASCYLNCNSKAGPATLKFVFGSTKGEESGPLLTGLIVAQTNSNNNAWRTASTDDNFNPIILPPEANLLNLQFSANTEAGVTFYLRQHSSNASDPNVFTLTLTYEEYIVPTPINFSCSIKEVSNVRKGFNPIFSWEAPVLLDDISTYTYYLICKWQDAATPPTQYTQVFECSGNAETLQCIPTYNLLHKNESTLIDIGTKITTTLITSYVYTVDGVTYTLESAATSPIEWVYFTTLGEVPSSQFFLNGDTKINETYAGEVCALKWDKASFDDKYYNGTQAKQIYYQIFFGENPEGEPTQNTSISFDRDVQKKYQTATPIRVVAFVKLTDDTAATYNKDLSAIYFQYVNSSRIYYYADNAWHQAKTIYYYDGTKWLEAYDIAYYNNNWLSCKKKAGE